METLTTIATTAATTTAWIAGCYFIADFATGVLHWAEDTWLVPGRSKFLDRYVVVDNVEHHRRPGTIRKGTYWETNRASACLAAGLAAIAAACHCEAWQVYFALLLGSQGNQVHKWAHMSDRPAIVAWLQSIGVLQSRSHHGKHHTHPYAVNYCALSNYLNPVLDRVGFWRGVEHTIEMFGGTVERGSAARGGY